MRDEATRPFEVKLRYFLGHTTSPLDGSNARVPCTVRVQCSLRIDVSCSTVNANELRKRAEMIEKIDLFYMCSLLPPEVKRGATGHLLEVDKPARAALVFVIAD